MYKKYSITTMYGEQVCIIRTSDNAHISDDASHSDYQQYMAWVAEGNTAEEYNLGE